MLQACVHVAVAVQNQHVLKAQLAHLAAQIVKLIFQRIAELVHQRLRAENHEYGFAVDGHVVGIGEVVFQPIRDEVIPEIRAGVGRRAVLRFPDEAEFHEIAVLGFQIGIVELRGIPCDFHGLIGIAPQPAERLEIDAVLRHKADFPIRRFRLTLVIVPQHGFQIVIGRNG